MTIEKLFRLVTTKEVQEYRQFELSLLGLSFTELHKRIMSLLDTRIPWQLFVAIETINSTYAEAEPRDYEEMSFLCPQIPSIADAMRRRLTLFLQKVPNSGLLEWYETVKKSWLKTWLAQQLLLEITTRMQTMTIHDTDVWFENLAKRVLLQGYLPELTPAMKATCLKLAVTAQNATHNPAH